MNYATESFSDLEARYASTEKFIEQMSLGVFRSIIVNGPPGVGKTYSVETYLKKYAPQKHTMVAGQMTPLSLYGHLYRNKEAGSILVLDDIDSVFEHLEGVNVLKAAMDTKAERVVSWSSQTSHLKAMNVPTQFEFNGGVILISNIGFGDSKKKMNAHLNALKDRSFSVQIAGRTNESLFRQVCFMVLKRNMLIDSEITTEQKYEILDYMKENMDRLTTISLRAVIKLAMLVKIDPANWRALANGGMII